MITIWDLLKPNFEKLQDIKLDIEEVIKLQELMMLRINKISKAIEKSEKENKENK